VSQVLQRLVKELSAQNVVLAAQHVSWEQYPFDKQEVSGKLTQDFLWAVREPLRFPIALLSFPSFYKFFL
jgi:hypothetical protein